MLNQFTLMAFASVQLGMSDAELKAAESSIALVQAYPEAHVGMHLVLCGKVRPTPTGKAHKEIYTVIDRKYYSIRLEFKLVGQSAGSRTCFNGVFRRINEYSGNGINVNNEFRMADSAVRYYYMLAELDDYPARPMRFAEPEQIAVKALRTQPGIHLNKYVRLCGKLEPPLSDGTREVSETVDREIYAIKLASTIKLQTTNSRHCYTGIFEHRLGLSWEEAARQGKAGTLTDNASHPWFWLRNKDVSRPSR